MDKVNNMERLIDAGLEELTVIVYKMGGTAEKALSMSINGFVEGKDFSKDVHELAEILVNRTVEVEEKAFSLIAKYQPVASDLRIINSYMKVAYDFERYGQICLGHLLHLYALQWENQQLRRLDIRIHRENG